MIEKLKAIANILNGLAVLNGANLEYKVESIYRDFGANLKHDTIVVYGDGIITGSFQIFSPRDLKEIDAGTYPIEEIVSLGNKYALKYM